MLAVRHDSGQPPAARINLPFGASAMVRPATSFESKRAAAEISHLLVGLVAAEETAQQAAALMGEDFAGADFTDPAWLQAAAERLSLIKLAAICTESWDGLAFDDDAPFELTEANLALLLRDPAIAAQFERAIDATIHAQAKEKKDSVRSPDGAAAADADTAPIAPAPAIPAPAAGED